MNIRPKVIISVFNNHEVLLAENYDSSCNLTSYIPVGGGVEFGEKLAIAAQRELEEELQIKNVPLTFLGYHEYIFTSDNVDRHEIMFHYSCSISDVMRSDLSSTGVDNGQSFKIKWLSKEALVSIRQNLVPPGIYSELLAEL